MTSQLILRVVFSFLPFLICLFWLVCFILHFRKNNPPKHYFTVYIATCVVLYLCHAIYFTIGAGHEIECLWTLCSLSVYPLFYGYVSRLTSVDFRARQLLPWLLPSFLVATAKYALPDAGMDRVRLLLFSCQVVCVCYLGIRRLNNFDRELKSVYADIEGRDTTSVHHMLVAIIVVSILSGVANSIGKHFFGEKLWFLIPISLAFSTLLFVLCHICFQRDFTIDNLCADEHVGENLPEKTGMEEDNIEVGRKIDDMLTVLHYYTRKDLKIIDIAIEAGTNRTYVSNYVNRHFQCSFSEFVNKQRVEYAKKLLTSANADSKLAQIADESGFANEQSFYRNFKKIVGKTPKEYLRQLEKNE